MNHRFRKRLLAGELLVGTMVHAAIGRVTQACRGTGVPLGIFGVTAEAVKPYIEQGYTLIVAGMDALMLGRQARQIVEQLL